MKIVIRSLFVVMAFCTVALFAQPTVNGDLSDSDYMSIATKQNSNAGFGGAIDVTEIVYYPDFTNSILYLGVKGKLDTGADNGMGLFLDIGGTGSPNGAAAGTELGFDGAGHFMDGEGSGTNDNFKADFEVDYMFAFNPGNGNTTVFWDASSLVGGTTAEYQGSCDQSGTAATNSNAAGGIFTQNSITFAFNNSGGANTGLELSIPFSELGASVAMNINVFTFIVSSSAFFSDVTVPGNVTTGNPGFNADFSTLSGGPYNSGTQALPVELTSFTASVVGNEITLNWQTATELNNLGFEIQRAVEEDDWTVIGFVQGAGNSEAPRVYSYKDNAVFSGTYSYRLKQIDVDGSFQYSPVVQVEVVEIPNGFVLEQNYPNPFNPTTLIKFGVENQSEGTLKVFNTNGEEVAELFAGTLNAGRIYEVEFNGDGLASGMYLYKLQTTEKVEVKKMMLLK